jgi:hypothetical protein
VNGKHPFTFTVHRLATYAEISVDIHEYQAKELAGFGVAIRRRVAQPEQAV